MMTDIHQGCYPYYYFFNRGEGKLKEMHTDYVYETLGRTIRLADVLLAFRGTSFAIVIDDAGDIYDHDNDPEEVLANWNLRADDATQQTDETLAFLASTL